MLETHVLRAGILLCYVGGHVSDKKQKRSERQAQREALRKWRQHEPLDDQNRLGGVFSPPLYGPPSVFKTAE